MTEPIGSRTKLTLSQLRDLHGPATVDLIDLLLHPQGSEVVRGNTSGAVGGYAAYEPSLSDVHRVTEAAVVCGYMIANIVKCQRESGHVGGHQATVSADRPDAPSAAAMAEGIRDAALDQIRQSVTEPMKISHYVMESIRGGEWWAYPEYATLKRENACHFTISERETVRLCAGYCWVAVMERREC